MTTTRYKGFKIFSRPYPLHASNSWTADLEIRRAGRAQPFSLNGRYQSEQQAQLEGLGMGRRIIDGGVPGWSVDRLRVAPDAAPTFTQGWKKKSRRPLLVAGIIVLGLGGFVLPTWVGGAAVVAGAVFVVGSIRKHA